MRHGEHNAEEARISEDLFKIKVNVVSNERWHAHTEAGRHMTDCSFISERIKSTSVVKPVNWAKSMPTWAVTVREEQS